MGMGRALAVVMGVPVMAMMMFVMMFLIMGVIVVPVFLIVPLDPGLALAASAYAAHHSTSSSLIRISSPPVTCNW
jgi:hypothetical protein